MTTSNTPTSDLDRDALEAAQSYEVPAAIEAIAAALKARRKELIHQPLSFIYRQLAEAALAALPRAFGAEPVAEQLAGIARKLRTYVHIYTGDKEARQMAEWCESHASVAPMTVATRAIAERWRNDAFGAAAEIVESWFGADGHECAANIRALISSAPTPPSASSGGGELKREEQALAAYAAFGDLDRRGAECGVEQLHANGFRIVRTAPSGEQC